MASTASELENRRIAEEIEKMERAKKSSDNEKNTQGKRHQKRS